MQNEDLMIKPIQRLLTTNYNSRQIKLPFFIESCMIQLKQNIFDEATQLVSLDCSTIIYENMTNSHNLSQSMAQSLPQSLHQSIVNLKSVLPTFTSEFNLFKQQIVDMSYFIVNKLMNVIKAKNSQIGLLKQELDNSMALNNTMKKQVIQLKEMISEFMDNYQKEIIKKQKQFCLKEKQISLKEKEISLKKNEINELKNILKQNFNSPRNFCKNCEGKISSDNLIISNLQNKEKKQSQETIINEFFRNYKQNEQILIEMSQSIICNTGEGRTKLSLQTIQEQGSEINSITDYLQSNRGSQKENVSKGSTQILKSSRSHHKQKQDLAFDQRFNFTQKLNVANLSSHQNTSQGVKAVNDIKIVGNLNILSNSDDKKNQDTFTSRLYTTNVTIEDSSIEIEKQKQRRCSEQFFPSKNLYEDFKIERKPLERTVLGIKSVDSQLNIRSPKQQQSQYKQHFGEQNQQLRNLKQTFGKNKQQFIQKKQHHCFGKQNLGDRKLQFAIGKQHLTLKAQMQQLSKSSSSSQLIHLGDSQKINVNLPKSFQPPKNMNFVKKNSSRSERQQRLQTEPTPRQNKFQINKQNISIEYQSKPLQIGKKIFARKKILMSHAKAHNTSRVQSKKNKDDPIPQNFNPKPETLLSQKNHHPIEIKYIDSPQKEPSELTQPFKLSIPDISTNQTRDLNNSRDKKSLDYNSANSNISAINQSIVKSHHLYHSTGKYQTEQSPRKSSKVAMTPARLQSKTQDRKSCSKSKQKLKVTSKSSNQQQIASHCNSSQNKKQKFIAEINQNQLLCNNQPLLKMKNRNLAVHIGNSKTQLRQNIFQIKQALSNYNLSKFYDGLKEVFFDGKLINGQREGQAKVVYDNGINFEGTFSQNKRYGEGKFTLNGIDVFEGQFINDRIEGQGYLKFLRFFANLNQCPKILQDASYFGRFSNSKLDGMGTLFLNQKQKIVTKFSNGIPYGELTYYSENDIQFSYWPTN